MRDRKEIQEGATTFFKQVDAMVEILLDIRDLLKEGKNEN